MIDIGNSIWTSKEWLFNGFGGAVFLAFLGFIGWIIKTIYHRRHKQNNAETKQIQIAGDNSVNIQAGGNLTVSNSHFGGRENAK